MCFHVYALCVRAGNTRHLMCAPFIPPVSASALLLISGKTLTKAIKEKVRTIQRNANVQIYSARVHGSALHPTDYRFPLNGTHRFGKPGRVKNIQL